MEQVDFKDLTTREKSKELFYKGKHLITKEFETFSMALFSLEDAYVEVVFSSSFQDILIHSSKTPPNLDVYFSQNLNDVLAISN